MIAMKISWLTLETLFLGIAAYFGSGTALAMAAALVLIPICSLFLNLRIRKDLDVQVSAALNARKGESTAIRVSLRNSSVFPALRVRCDVQAENQLNRETHTFRVNTWLPSQREQTAELSVGSDYCGRLRISVERVRLYDCFGLIGIGCECNAIAHTTVQPDMFAMDISLLPSPDGSEDSDVYSQDRPGWDMTETFQIREYVPGDSPRQVHWKLSNKFDRLIVRDPALPVTRNVLVFWERTGASGDPELIDAQAETVVSLCRSLLDSGIRFSIGWNDTDRNLCVLHEIRDMDELVGIIPRLMRATGAKEGVSGAGLLLQTRSEALCAHMVYIAEEPQCEVTEMQRFGHVAMLLSGGTAPAGAVMFDAAHYKEQLTRIEL